MIPTKTVYRIAFPASAIAKITSVYKRMVPRPVRAGDHVTEKSFIFRLKPLDRRGQIQPAGEMIIIKDTDLGMIKWKRIATGGNPQYGVQYDRSTLNPSQTPAARLAIPSTIPSWRGPCCASPPSIKDDRRSGRGRSE